MNDLRTILLLGGSAQQIVAIEQSRRCGYRTVLCDYLPDNPGQHFADVFHLVSTTDKEAVLEVARAERVDGVVAYASDPAAPTAAYVAEQLGLPTNPLKGVEVLSTKTLFRAHMRDQGLPCPQAVAIPAGVSVERACELVSDLRFPIVMKPTDSSGSKGVTVLDDLASIGSALDFARMFSRNSTLIAEEYIYNINPFVVAGDIFVLDGAIRFWGFTNCLRSDEFPLLPYLDTMPTMLSPDTLARTKEVLQALVSSLGIRFGGLNVEVIIGKDDIPYVVELGARAGGNMLPVQLTDASGIDLVRASMMCAMGDDPGALDWETDGGCNATYVLHAMQPGTYRGYVLSDELKAACYRECVYKKLGDRVEPFKDASDALGILFFRFENEAEMYETLSCINDGITVHVK